MIRLFLLTALTMVAFAANSVLTRIGIDRGAMDPMSFALIRVATGAAVLVLLVRMRGVQMPFSGRSRWVGGVSLTTYMLGFSLAYVSLDAGLGALIVFGTVQITMFAWAVVIREPVPLQRWLGATLALGGLGLLFLPGAATPPILGTVLMVLAGIGWGAYSLAGRAEGDPLAGTAANFLLCLPMTVVAALAFGVIGPMTWLGLLMAFLSGGVASAMGYALWYSILPQLGATRAAVAQLSAPVIAILAGALLLGEVLTERIVLASAIVLGGIALSLFKGSLVRGKA